MVATCLSLEARLLVSHKTKNVFLNISRIAVSCLLPSGTTSQVILPDLHVLQDEFNFCQKRKFYTVTMILMLFIVTEEKILYSHYE